MCRSLALTLALAHVGCMSLTATPSFADDVFFEASVQAIFQNKCGKCHSAKSRKADLGLNDYKSVSSWSHRRNVIRLARLKS